MGATGLEPVASSVWTKRSPTELSALVIWYEHYSISALECQAYKGCQDAASMSNNSKLLRLILETLRSIRT